MNKFSIKIGFLPAIIWIRLLHTAVTKNNYPPIAIAKSRIIINFCQGVRSDRRIIARMSLIVRNLVKQGFWQYASLTNRLLGVI
ncbi:MAG: hypothetical protein EWV78_12050 [Microcystis aeruginosa Ma_MB_F_20061100_S20D]|uniref:Transposase n=1 Tax=Microcystis aeruginosa Ma_MB_F_20061100_S20D TaxID=2486253 RepID=A0A552EKF3_MICAE|nr:MAG: hypothetical protein EWV78_12050 [Microcystis aeruginosa Ma_MB_F_20061100_S20D]